MLGFFCRREFENHQHLPLGVSIFNMKNVVPERETSLVAGSMLNPTLASLLDEEKDARREKNRGLQ
jgi:hypothetical protein